MGTTHVVQVNRMPSPWYLGVPGLCKKKTIVWPVSCDLFFFIFCSHSHLNVCHFISIKWSNDILQLNVKGSKPLLLKLLYYQCLYTVCWHEFVSPTLASVCTHCIRLYLLSPLISTCGPHCCVVGGDSQEHFCTVVILEEQPCNGICHRACCAKFSMFSAVLISPLPSFPSPLWEQATFSGIVSMATCNYPRHQQFMLNNFIIDRMGMIAAASPNSVFHRPHLVLCSSSTCFSRMHVCGSKYSIQTANCCTPVSVRQRRISEECQLNCLPLCCSELRTQ